MTPRDLFRKLAANERVRFALFVIGCALILLAPIVGPLPGPGGVIFLIVGLSLALKNSRWAKKRYVDFKKRFPRYGHWTDWGLRRQSAKRRHAITKRQAGEDD